MDEITSRRNIEDAFDYVISHLECQEQKDKYRPQRQLICDSLQTDIQKGTFRVKEYKEMIVKDGPKERVVQAPRVYYRIGCHAIMVVVEKHLHQTLIKNTAASIKGRGMHWLHHIVDRKSVV